MDALYTVGFVRLYNIPNWDENELFNAVETFHN